MITSTPIHVGFKQYFRHREVACLKIVETSIEVDLMMKILDDQIAREECSSSCSEWMIPVGPEGSA